MSWPLLREGLDVGFTYVNYQILSGGVLLAAFFLATEMTSRPITGGGQVIFGILGGAAAMLLKLYFDTAIPAYLAVLIANTATPTIDWLWRGRAFGQKRFRWVRKLFRKAE
jgi:electron transport complex protein RnfD